MVYITIDNSNKRCYRKKLDEQFGQKLETQD